VQQQLSVAQVLVPRLQSLQESLLQTMKRREGGVLPGVLPAPGGWCCGPCGAPVGVPVALLGRGPARRGSGHMPT
jgi:hypothetical protein